MKKNRKCLVFIFNGYADWEPSLLVSGLNQYTDFSIETFSVDKKPVTSMGGFVVQPHLSLEEVDPDTTDLLVLPGGEAWEKGENQEIIPLVQKAAASSAKIAAICAATTFLVKQGYLSHIAHTSNGKEYLKHVCPDYDGESHYLLQPCVSSEKFITANGAGFIEFTYEIFKAFKIMEEPLLEAWLELYKSGGMINKFVD